MYDNTRKIENNSRNVDILVKYIASIAKTVYREDAKMQILEHRTLEMHNLLSYRGKMTQQELVEKSRDMEEIIQQSGAEKNGCTMTTTFSVEQGPNGPVLDMEILIPLDREISVPQGYAWKPDFLLTNALMVKHLGNPAGLQESIQALNQFILDHGLVPISTGYNVTVREAKTPMELDSMEVDIYVGISPNKL